MCCNVTHYFSRDAKRPDPDVIFSKDEKKTLSRDVAASAKMQKAAANLYCSICKTMLNPFDTLTRDHLKYQCTAIPSTPLRPGYSKKDLARRMAALGSKKKLHKHNFTPH